MTSSLHRFLQRTTSGAAIGDTWHALRTRFNGERVLGELLRAQGIEVFDPQVPAWSWRGGVRRESVLRLFPGHLFLKDAWGGTPETRGADPVGFVPAGEIEPIRRAIAASLTPIPHPYLEDGWRVRIRRGALDGVEGYLLETRGGRGLLVLSIHLFRRSVAVAIDRAHAVPV